MRGRRQPRSPRARSARSRGLRQVLSTPGLVQVFCLYMVAFASLVTVQVVWAGPYLHDVYNLDTVQRGNVLLGMALVQTGGVAHRRPARPPLQHAQMGCRSALGMPALTGDDRARPGTVVAVQLAVGFLFLLSGSSAYGGVLFAQIIRLFLVDLAGRSATITNMAPAVWRRGAAAAHRLHPGAVPAAGGRLFAARLPVHLRLAGLLPCRRASRST